MVNLYQLAKKDVKEAAVVVAKAFSDYPAYNYLISQGKKRLERLSVLFEFLIRFGLRYGKVYSNSPNLEGISIWLYTENEKDSILRYLRCGIVKGTRKIGIRDVMKSIKVSDHLDKKTELYASSEPNWHLQIIAVLPELQRKGYGSELMNEVFNDPEFTGPYYLDTQLEENLPFYQRHGFEIVGKDKIPNTDISSWYMLRKR